MLQRVENVIGKYTSEMSLRYSSILMLIWIQTQIKQFLLVKQHI